MAYPKKCPVLKTTKSIQGAGGRAPPGTGQSQPSQRFGSGEDEKKKIRPIQTRGGPQRAILGPILLPNDACRASGFDKGGLHLLFYHFELLGGLGLAAQDQHRLGVGGADQSPA